MCLSRLRPLGLRWLLTRPLHPSQGNLPSSLPPLLFLRSDPDCLLPLFPDSWRGYSGRCPPQSLWLRNVGLRGALHPSLPPW